MSILYKAAARQAVLIGIKWKASNGFSWDILKANWFWPIFFFFLLRSFAPLILWCSLLQWNHANPSRTWLWNSEEVDILVGSLAGNFNLVPGWFFNFLLQIYLSNILCRFLFLNVFYKFSKLFWRVSLSFWGYSRAGQSLRLRRTATRSAKESFFLWKYFDFERRLPQERWLSGRKRLIANPLYELYSYRGFESLSLRKNELRLPIKKDFVPAWTKSFLILIGGAPFFCKKKDKVPAERRAFFLQKKGQSLRLRRTATRSADEVEVKEQQQRDCCVDCGWWWCNKVVFQLCWKVPFIKHSRKDKMQRNAGRIRGPFFSFLLFSFIILWRLKKNFLLFKEKNFCFHLKGESKKEKQQWKAEIFILFIVVKKKN